VNSGPLSELAFSAATGMMGPPVSGAGEAPEPALEVSTGSCAGEHLELGIGGAYLLSPGSVHFTEGKTVTPPWLPDGESWLGDASIFVECQVSRVAVG